MCLERRAARCQNKQGLHVEVGGGGGEELTWRACESEKFSVFELWGNIFRLSDVAPVNRGVSPSNWFCSSNKLEIFAGADAVDECLSLCTVSVCVCV